MKGKIKSKRTVSKLSEDKKKEILKELGEVVGPEWVSDDPAFGASWGRDNESRIDEPTYYPDFVILPVSAEEVSEIMKIASKHQLEVGVASGGASTFGLIMMHNGGILVDTRRMDKILEIDEESMTATVEAGVALARLRVEANKRNLRNDVPGGPTATAVIGNLSMMGGEHFNNTRYNYGITKLLGAEIVTPTGRIIRTGQLAFPDAKPGACGPDWDLSTIGASSDGLAGIWTKAVIKLFPLGDKRKYRKSIEFGFFGSYVSATDVMVELAVEDLAKAVGEAGPKYYSGALPTATLEDHFKLLSALAPAYETVVWVDMEGTERQVKYQKKRAREILEKHGGDLSLMPAFDLIFNKPTKAEFAARMFKAMFDVDTPPYWLPRLAEMFDISETPARGFGVGGQVLAGDWSRGVANLRRPFVVYSDLMKKMKYPGYEKGLWATYGTIFRGSTAKAAELDVHYDRADPESCDWRDKYFASFATEIREKKIPFFIQFSAFGQLTVPPEAVIGPKGAEMWFKMRDLLDPNRTMHRHRGFDQAGIKV